MGKKSFRFLWIGQTMANAGDILFIVGLISTIYLLSGSALLMALLPFFNMTARFISALLAPFLLDRMLLQRLLAFSQMGKTAVLFALAIFSGIYLTEELIWALFIFVVVIAFLDGWASPARNALIPRLVEKEELVKANSFIGVADQLVQLGMWPLGAIFAAWLGAQEVVWLTVGLYICSSFLMVLLMKSREIKKAEIELNQSKFEGFKEGWVAIVKSPFLFVISVSELIESNANVVWIAAIMFVYVAEVLQAGEEWWGYINSSFFAGLLLGGILGLRYSMRIEEKTRFLIIVGALFTAAITVVFALIESPLTALVLSALFGFCSQLKGVAQQTLVQKRVAERLLPKVYSAQEAAYFSMFGLSTLGFGYLTEIYGPRFIFLLAGGLLFASAVLLVVFRRHLTDAGSGSESSQVVSS
ncbi:MFS transporter [Jeotgalibacillus sp. ET6]|uniref:MFS transporter n=1 Tax=Jeotgalibacillus sp. ET6 TaxID=3037260 RepID=UPI0024189E39|nr:MFS transporter [Jeotgalibacillus sp. ET6]MDG5472281.1 MFS transporter [Jeotgalibacillus sp. ET6]